MKRRYCSVLGKSVDTFNCAYGCNSLENRARQCKHPDNPLNICYIHREPPTIAISSPFDKRLYDFLEEIGESSDAELRKTARKPFTER